MGKVQRDDFPMGAFDGGWPSGRPQIRDASVCLLLLSAVETAWFWLNEIRCKSREMSEGELACDEEIIGTSET